MANYASEDVVRATNGFRATEPHDSVAPADPAITLRGEAFNVISLTRNGQLVPTADYELVGMKLINLTGSFSPALDTDDQWVAVIGTWLDSDQILIAIKRAQHKINSIMIIRYDEGRVAVWEAGAPPDQIVEIANKLAGLYAERMQMRMSQADADAHEMWMKELKLCFKEIDAIDMGKADLIGEDNSGGESTMQVGRGGDAIMAELGDIDQVDYHDHLNIYP